MKSKVWIMRSLLQWIMYQSFTNEMVHINGWISGIRTLRATELDKHLRNTGKRAPNWITVKKLIDSTIPNVKTFVSIKKWLYAQVIFPGNGKFAFFNISTLSKNLLK